MRTRVPVFLAAAAAGVAAVSLSAAATGTSPAGNAKDSARTPQVGSVAKIAKSTKATPTRQGPVGEDAQPSAAGTAAYWTPERIRNATPMEKTVPSSSPSVTKPSGSGAPSTSSPTTVRPKAAAKPKRAQSAPTSGPIGNTTADASDYWTKGKLDSAGPKNNTVPTDDGSSGASEPDPPIILVPGS